MAPGNYILDIWLNDQPVREQYPVRVVPVAGRDAAVICVTTDMVAMLGLKDKIIHGLKPVTGIPDGQCLELRSADSQVRYSAENQRLTFIIPKPDALSGPGLGASFTLERRRHRRPARLQPDGQPLYAAAGRPLPATASTAPPGLISAPGGCGAIISTAVLTVGGAHHSPIFICRRRICSVPCQHCAQN